MDDSRFAKDCLRFEYTGDPQNGYEESVPLSFVLNPTLTENHHALVASAGNVRETLCIEDSYVYFLSDSGKRRNSAQKLIREVAKAPLRTANWITNAVGVHA